MKKITSFHLQFQLFAPQVLLKKKLMTISILLVPKDI